MVKSIRRLHSLDIVHGLANKPPITSERNVKPQKYDTLLLHEITSRWAVRLPIIKIIMTEFILKGRLDGRQRNRLKSLFDMFYSPKELADEIGMHVDQVYNVYVPLGCPQQRGERNHLLINGKLFAEWYSKVYVHIHLEQDETFCKTCRKGVKIVKPKKYRKGNLEYLLSKCPRCGRKLSRFIANQRRERDR